MNDKKYFIKILVKYNIDIPIQSKSSNFDTLKTKPALPSPFHIK